MSHILWIALLLVPAPVSTWRMKVTAYDGGCALCCEKWSGCGVTSTGRDASLPGVASDPRVLPYGSVIDIPGVGIRTVDDTGGAMRKDARQQVVHIDVRMSSHAEARKWGVKWLEVKVLKYGRSKRISVARP